MFNGAHAIIYSKSAEADRTFLADVLGLPSVDVGRGWLIFGLPPAEVAVHPADGEGGRHELYLMCENIDVFVATMAAKGIACSDVSNQGWGMLSNITLPGGGELGVYQPRHARPPAFEPATIPANPVTTKPAAKTANQSAVKKPAPRTTTKKPATKPATKTAKKPATKTAKKPATKPAKKGR